MPRILITPNILYQARGGWRDVLEQAGLEPVFPEPTVSLFDPAVLAEHLKGIDGVLASVEPYTPEILANSQLRCIARMGVGYDAIHVPSATEHRVAVTITPGTNEHSVAELTMALVLGVYRGFPGRDQEVRNGVWVRQILPRLAGKTIGLLGMGRIGRAVVPRAIGLGLKVIAYDPFPNSEYAAKHGVTMGSLDEVLSTADIVSLHLPCTPETFDLINARTLAQMKPGATLINTSRGGLVDEDALADALRSGHLFAAGLDVFKVEPLPLDSPLLQLNNVLLAPHMGGLDHESEAAMSRMAAECLANLFHGRWPEGCVVNESIRSGWKW